MSSSAWNTLLIWLMVFGGCTPSTPAKPEIPEIKLVAILADLHLAGARSELFNDLPPGRIDSVLALHNLSTESFEATLDYYAEHTQEYVKIYDQVIDYLSESRPTLPTDTLSVE